MTITIDDVTYLSTDYPDPRARDYPGHKHTLHLQVGDRDHEPIHHWLIRVMEDPSGDHTTSAYHTTPQAEPVIEAPYFTIRDPKPQVEQLAHHLVAYGNGDRPESLTPIGRIHLFPDTEPPAFITPADKPSPKPRKTTKAKKAGATQAPADLTNPMDIA